MDVLYSKVFALLVLLLSTLILGSIPYFIIKHANGIIRAERYERVIHLLNSFAGGVFLGTCLLHLLAEGREEMEAALDELKETTDYPVFESLTAVGFFLIVIVDYIASICVDMNSGANMKINVTSPAQHNYHTFDNGVHDDSEAIVVGGARKRSDSVHSHDMSRLAGIQSTMKALMLLIALSFHTIFDGLAVGLQYSSVDVWQVMIAVGIHKSLVAFCLGLQLFNAYQDRPRIAWVMLLLFSLMSPIGLGIGIGLTSGHINNASKLLASAILQAFATGTFLYVTFFEILRESFMSKSSIWNIVVCIIGFAAMAGVKVLDKD